GPLEFRHVLQHAVYPITPGRMWIYADQHAGKFGTSLLAPYPAHAEEEALLGSVAVNLFCGLAARILSDGFAQGGQRDAGAAVIGGIFAQRQLAVELEVVYGDEVPVLVGDAAGALLKFLAILRRPPIAQIAAGIELAALIVEAVSELVANDVADAAEIDGIIHGFVEEWRLQNAGGEDDLVARAVVVGVDRRRRHAPFLAIERLIDLGNLPARFKFVGPLVIAQQVAVTDAQFGVVAPNIGIADLVADGVEFYFGLLFGVSSHPGQAGDVLI